MHRIDFGREIGVFEVRDPLIEACREVAETEDLYVTFRQPQQKALSGSPHQSRSQRVRIGNGKHKNWYVDFQTDHPSKSRPNVIGTLAIKGPHNPAHDIYGGFWYSPYGEPDPTYTHITLWSPSELDFYRPKDLPQPLLAASILAIEQTFDPPPKLFEGF